MVLSFQNFYFRILKSFSFYVFLIKIIHAVEICVFGSTNISTQLFIYICMYIHEFMAQYLYGDQRTAFRSLFSVLGKLKLLLDKFLLGYNSAYSQVGFKFNRDLSTSS